MKALLLGGAKRVSMARFFIRSAESRGDSMQLYSYEISTHVPIALVAKPIVGLRWTDPGIYDHLYSIIRANGIGLIVPFVDGAVAVAAEMTRRYPGEVFAPTTSPEMAELMFDKVRAAAHFTKLGLPIPATYTAGMPAERLIAKPRHGSASKGLVNIDSASELAALAPHLDDYLVQERIDRRVEFTVDCYVTVGTGRIRAIVPRKRIEVSGGEVTHTETVICPEVYDLAKLTLERTGLRGAVTIQVLHDLDTDRYLLMEINPRLGGGAVCSVYAGVDLPGLIIDDALGIDGEYVCYRPNTEIVRYPQDLAFFN